MDEMIDSMTGDAILGRRLEAFAEARLTPDLTTSSRLRARVLAVAHRHADLARADTGLIVLPQLHHKAGSRPLSARARDARLASGGRGRARWRRAAAVLLAASVGIGMAAGTAFAARPGGPMYEARLWAETLTLPADPSARAVAELERLEQRLREVAEASRSGDTAGVTAALTAYETIMEKASSAAILAGDDVAAAILETGVGRNVEVLRALLAHVPSQASTAISRALENAIDRSTAAVNRIGASRPGNGNGRGDGAGTGQPASDPTSRPTKAPRITADPVETATPKPKPTNDRPEPTLKPSPEPTPEPTPPPEPTEPPKEDRKPAPPDPPKPRHGGGPRLQGG